MHAMDKLLITGGRPLDGEVRISGAKNAALPICARRCSPTEPLVLDERAAAAGRAHHAQAARAMGVRVGAAGDGRLRRCSAGARSRTRSPLRAGEDHARLGPGAGAAAGALRRAKVSLPGGCAIGSRPVDQHIKGLQAMGARSPSSTATCMRDGERLKGARIVTDMVTVTGTENLMMAAGLAEGSTVLENAAREPEVVDLANCLIAMGARIEGAGTGTIRIEGVRSLAGATHRVMPDRIETGTFLCAVAAAGGEVRLMDTCARHPGRDAREAARGGREDRGGRRRDRHRDGRPSSSR